MQGEIPIQPAGTSTQKTGRNTGMVFKALVVETFNKKKKILSSLKF